jgi:hypothetical protein
MNSHDNIVMGDQLLSRRREDVVIYNFEDDRDWLTPVVGPQIYPGSNAPHFGPVSFSCSILLGIMFHASPQFMSIFESI